MIHTLVNALKSQKMDFFMQELYKTSSSGGGLKPGDRENEILSSRDGKNWRSFFDINTATLWAITRTLEPESHLYTMVGAAGIGDDPEQVAELVRDTYMDALAIEIDEDGSISYWATPDGFPE